MVKNTIGRIGPTQRNRNRVRVHGVNDESVFVVNEPSVFVPNSEGLRPSIKKAAPLRGAGAQRRAPLGANPHTPIRHLPHPPAPRSPCVPQSQLEIIVFLLRIVPFFWYRLHHKGWGGVVARLPTQQKFAGTAWDMYAQLCFFGPNRPAGP